MALSVAQLDHFHERGWLLMRGIIPLREVRQAAQDLAPVHQAAFAGESRDGRMPWAGTGASWDVTIPPDREPRIEQLMGSEQVSPALARIAKSSAVVDILDQLMLPGQDLRFFHSKTLMRAHDAQSRFPWHQDFGYWQYGHRAPVELNCAIAIDAQTVENGCLKFVNGSQRGGLVPHQHFERLVESTFGIGLPGDINAYAAEAVTYEPGDALFFGPLVIHGSDINRSGADARFNTFAYDLSGNSQNAGEGSMIREREQRLFALAH